MSDEAILNADAEVYRQAAALDSGPPTVTSDPLVVGGTPIEQLLRALGLAANGSDPLDDSGGLDAYAERDAAMAGAAEGFVNQDSAAGAEMSQLPQMAAGIAGAVAGALLGALQPAMQLPAQLAQGAGQALQAGTALMSQYGAEDPATFDSPDDAGFPASDEPLAAGGGFDDQWPPDDLSPLSGSGAGSATTPMAVLGPAPMPSASTAPASAAPLSPRSASIAPAQTVGVGGMAGMPMIPPGPLSATPASTAVPPETKRVAAPAVRNGAPVQGRITGPPAAPLPPRTLQGRPVEARRIVVPPAIDDSGSPA